MVTSRNSGDPRWSRSLAVSEEIHKIGWIKSTSDSIPRDRPPSELRARHEPRRLPWQVAVSVGKGPLCGIPRLPLILCTIEAFNFLFSR